MASTYTPIATQTLGSAASSVTFSSIAGTYTDLIIVANSTTSVNDRTIKLQFNSDTASNYSYTNILGYSGGAISQRGSAQTSIQWGSSSDTSGSNIYILNVQNYANTTTYKTTISRGNVAGASSTVDSHVGVWRSTSAITSLLIFPSTGNFNTGSTFTLYGIKAA